MKKILIILSVIFFSIDLFSQETSDKHRIDIELEECLNNEWTQSTVDIMLCADNALNEWDKELNVVYQKLMKLLNDDQKKTLRQAQKEWIKYRDLEFSNIDSIYEMDGTMWGQVRIMERLEIVKNRTLSLQNYLNALDY